MYYDFHEGNALAGNVKIDQCMSEFKRSGSFLGKDY